MTLRDRVRTAVNRLGPAGERLARSSCDAGLPLGERLRAFDELTDLEVGDTALVRARGLERVTGLAPLYLKREGDNPTGTQKDRIAFAQVRAALAARSPGVALATCGNYGAAVALAARAAGLPCRVYLPAGYHSERVAQIEALGAELLRLPGTYEDVVAASSRRAAADGWADANPGPRNASLQIAAYAACGREIARDLAADAPPAAVGVPVSNGTLLAGVAAGLREGGSGWTPGLRPRLVAGSSTRKNPITASFREGLTACRDLDPARIRETATNEPLINWHAFDGDHALAALRASGGAAVDVSDRSLRDAAALLRKAEGYAALPAATAGLCALLHLHERGELPGDRPVVAVVTARR